VLQIVLNVLLVVHWQFGVIGVILSGVVASAVVSGGLTAYVTYYKRPKFDWPMTWKMLQFCWPLWFAGLAGLYIGSSIGSICGCLTRCRMWGCSSSERNSRA